MNLSRRKFVYVAAGGVTLVSTAVLLRRPVRAVLNYGLDVIHPPAKRIRETFHYLRVSDGVIARYLEDWQKYNGSISGSGFRRDRIFLQRFLLSTDFFQNNQDTGREVSYVLYYDPYVSPCYNPLLPQFLISGSMSNRAGTAS